MRGGTWWYVFAVSFVAIALAESFLPAYSLSSSTSRRWTSNSILLAISSVLVVCAYQLTGIAVASTAAASSRGLVNHVAIPYWVRFVIGFAVVDLTAYISHRTFHATAPLWRVHRVHHSETDLDLTTGLRFHPVEALFVQGLLLAVIAVLGLPPAAVALAGLTIIIQNFLTHANLRVPDFAERWLGLLIITPGMHRLHHSENVPEQNTNFGTIFSIWDRLFGTYNGELGAEAEQVRYGLAEIGNGSKLHAGGLLLLPFRRQSKAYSREST